MLLFVMKDEDVDIFIEDGGNGFSFLVSKLF